MQPWRAAVDYGEALCGADNESPTGHPADPKADEDSTDRHDRQKGGRGSKNGGSSYGSRTAYRRAGRQRIAAGDKCPERRRRHGSVGRRLNPPEKDPSSRTPYHSKPTTIRPPRASNDPRRSSMERRQPGRLDPADRPPRGHVRTSTPPRQSPVNQRHQQPITMPSDPAGRTDTHQPALDPSGTNPRPKQAEKS